MHDKHRRIRPRGREVTLSIREHLNPELVLKATDEAARAGLGNVRSSVWLTDGSSPPFLAFPGVSGRHPEPQVPPRAVVDATVHRSLIIGPEGSSVAVPIFAPRSGLVGAIHVEGRRFDREEIGLLEEIARESGMALESANLYERAIAEKEKSEAILAHVGDGVVVTDPKGKILQINAAAARMLDCSPQDVLGRSCSAILGMSSGERGLDCSTQCQLLALASGPEALSGVEVWRSRDGDGRQPLLATASSVRDPDGSISEVVHSFRDITRLKEADEAKTLFLATASHELKTPLTVIQGFSQLLSQSRFSTDDQRSRAMEAIERRAVQLNKIVDRLLLSSRIEAGKVEMSVEDLDILPILAERVQALSAATGRAIELRAPEELPPALVDADGLTTVIDHLLDNAVKYSPEGGQVCLSAAVDDSHVVVSVSDEGIGMDPERQAHCFDKFWQGESGDARRFGGTGIGLFIVRSLVEAMGGEVDLESVPGEGSTFRVSLRRAGKDIESGDLRISAPEGVMADQSVIREFMRQLGIPTGGKR